MAENTTVPMPHLQGYGFGPSETNPTGLPFLLLDYVPGKQLCGTDLPGLSEETTTRFYEQLGSIYAQLRQQEFSRTSLPVSGISTKRG